MNFLDSLFGRKKKAPPTTVVTAPVDPSKDPNMIRVFDSYGRELFITKDEWRKNVLPGTIKTNWNDPEQLYGLIVGALTDGFCADVVGAAKHLYELDPDPERGTCIWGIVLTKMGRLDEAEQVFRGHIAKHGESGIVLTNLAKVYADQKDDQKSEQTLWNALEVDPNQDNGLDWYGAIHFERGGEAARLAAMQRVAAIPGSWRAQLWLARAALESKELPKAIALYSESLSRVGKPVPADFLKQMSGDLGNAGHLNELLQLAEPHFDSKLHGLAVGNNLIKANVDLGRLPQAREILEQLYALNRPDYKDHLGFWDTEIAKAKLAAAPVDDEAKLQITMLTGRGPIWLKPDSTFADLFGEKLTNSPVFCFLGSSVTLAVNPARIQQQLANAYGRLSRALPLFLAEQLEMGSDARSQTLIPWVVAPNPGFIVSGGPWSDADAINHAQHNELKNDFVITTHLTEASDQWTASLRLIRVTDAQCLAELSHSFPLESPGEAVLSLSQRLLASLPNTTPATPQPCPPPYTVPTPANLPNYLLRLEQLLATRCAALDGVNADFLNGEREIIDGNILQCVAHPGSVSMRILLVQTLLAMKKVRPEILPEFAAKVRQLQKEHILVGAAHERILTVVDEALGV